MTLFAGNLYTEPVGSKLSSNVSGIGVSIKYIYHFVLKVTTWILAIEDLE